MGNVVETSGIVVINGGIVWNAVGFTATTVVADPEMSLAQDAAPSESAKITDACTVADFFDKRGRLIAPQQ
jgi:hypothetical protein